MSNRPHAPFSIDGTIDRKSVKKITDVGGAPGMDIVLRGRVTNDVEEGALRELAAVPGAVVEILRSSYAQMGLDLSPTRELDIRGKEVLLSSRISSHRGAANDVLLSTMRELVQQKVKISPGGLLVASPDSALTREEIHEEIDQGRILLPDRSSIDEHGVIALPLEHGYAFGEEIFTSEVMRDILLGGRHALRALMTPIPLPRKIPAGAFMLGGIKGLSLGGAQGILSTKTSLDGVPHHKARALHQLRSTGVRISRQTETRNENPFAVDTGDLKVYLQLHHSSDHIRNVAARVINPRSLHDGLDLHDLLVPERFMRLSHLVSSRRIDTEHAQRPYGYLFTKDVAAEIPWATQKHFQQVLTLQRVRQGLTAHPSQHGKTWVDGPGIPEPARALTKELGYVAHDHHGKVLVTGGFPEPHTARTLLEQGVGVFVAHSLYTPADAYVENDPTDAHGSDAEVIASNGAAMKKQALFFDTGLYEATLNLERAGAEYVLVLPDMADEMSHGDVIPAHVREFERGLWVKPEAKDRLRKVSTIIAMYGSHVKGMEPVLMPQLQDFMREMKQLFGEEVAVTHGKGPGVMKMADDAAAEAGIPRIGVGICVEGQAGNCRPEAMVDFFDTDRLRRQKLMDDLATFKIFNLGGAGTLEEAAITLCSQKLGKKAITPVIFVDPVGAGKDGTHLWAELQEQIRTLATSKTLDLPDSDRQLVLQLLQDETPNYIHCVQSYAGAAATIRGFKEDPAGYYHDKGIPDKAVAQAFARQNATLAQTGFPPPSFLERPDIPSGRVSDAV